MKNRYMLVVITALFLFIAAGSARADTINFDAQAVGAPNGFNGSVNSPLVIGDATFTGGQLLINETSSVDETGVYATTDIVAGAYTDPITITFSQAVSAFSIEVTNNEPDTFTVADNLGGSETLALPLLAQQTFDLSGTGITSVTVSAADTSFFDYAIDNVSFTPVATPEPGTLSLTLIGVGLSGLMMVIRKRKYHGLGQAA